MPSLHYGWDLLVGIAIVTAATTTWLRVVGWLLPVAMVLAVIATANHFVLDVVAGVALALVGHAAALRPGAAAARALPGGRRDRPRDRPPGRELPGRAARGQRARRRRHRVRRARVPRPAGGPAPEDRRAPAVPVGPVGAGLRVGAAAGPARAARGRPARHDVHARPQGSPCRGRPVGRPAAARRSATTGRSWSAAGTGRRWSVLAGLPYVRPVLSARTRAELARLRTPGRRRRPRARRLDPPQPARRAQWSRSCCGTSRW